MAEEGVEEDGKMTIASVLTEVTVTVAGLDEAEAATDDEADWEEQRAEREKTTSREANTIIQTRGRKSDAEKRL